MPRKILLTGAAGRIGSFLTAHLTDQYDFVLTDKREPAESHGFPFTQANLTEFETMLELCQGVDTVVHLAADPRMAAPWDSLLPNNVIGLYNIFEAAHQAGCRRVVYASSINAVAGYPTDQQIRTSMPVRPLNLYGATKVWGEAVACFYADQRGLSSICLRFGAVLDRENVERITPDFAYIDALLTYHDLTRLIVSSIEAPDDLTFGIYHGASNNRWNRLDISDARAEIGYEPEDDAFVISGLFEA